MKKIEITKILELHKSGTLKTDQAVEQLCSVVEQSEHLKTFTQFLYNNEYLVRCSIDEAIEEFKKSL